MKNTVIGVLAGVTVGFIVGKVVCSNSCNKEIKRLNAVLLPLAKKQGSGVTLADLTPGTVVAE